MIHNPDKKILELRQRIKEHNQAYYQQHDPKISDQEYDQLVKELQLLEMDDPTLFTLDSPSAQIGETTTEGFQEVHHQVRMYSMDNTYNENELMEFDERVCKNLLGQPIQYVCEVKVDGLAVSLRYENGILVQGSTRGNGVVGDNITQNIKTIHDIPQIVKGEVPSVFEVRGEVYMEKLAFQKMNEQRDEEGLPLFMNPRNAAAGSLKLLDANETAKRPLRFFAHGLGFIENNPFENYWQWIQFLEKCGFSLTPQIKLCHHIEEVLDVYRDWERLRDQIDFDIDGLVVKVNSLVQQDRLGYTTKVPRWAVAYKFKAEKIKTKLHKITIQVGRTGILTPVAELEPVFLAGSTISRATLHNIDEIQRKDIREGDMVWIEKGGDVIPKVTQVELSERASDSKNFQFPKNCPSCQAKVVRDAEGVYWRCLNGSCQAQLKKKIEHFSARNAMDIEGLGTALIEQCVDQKLIQSIPDIYRLKADDLIPLERMGKKSTINLLDSIEKSKKQPFSKVLFAMGIRHVGQHVARVLVDHFGDIESLKRTTKDELSEIHEIGPIVADSIILFFQSTQNQSWVQDLFDLGLNFQEDKIDKITDHEFSGKTVVLTGELESMTRDEAKKILIRLNAKATNSVSKKTDFIICGKNPGSKFEKAQKLKLICLSESEFLKKIQDFI